MNKIEIIAEIGKNFIDTREIESESVLIEKAKKLILSAKESGADTAKFQCHIAEDEVLPNANIISPHFNQDRESWIRRNTYSADFWWKLKEFCREIGIEFLVTPMSRNAAILLNEEIGVDRWKIGSGDILDFVMLDYIRDSGKPVILSSGMSSFEELKKSYDYISEKVVDVSILHCVSLYPCPLSALNLRTITFLKEKFPKAKIGFSDHSLGIDGSLMAVSLGAGIIEKHFSFDRNAFGPDHKVSLLPSEMERMADRIKKQYPTFSERYGVFFDDHFFEEALGSETKYLKLDEEKFRPVFRKGLYASRDIRRGELFEPEMIYALRPRIEGSRPSEEYPLILGAFADKDYKKYESI